MNPDVKKKAEMDFLQKLAEHMSQTMADKGKPKVDVADATDDALEGTPEQEPALETPEAEHPTVDSVPDADMHPDIDEEGDEPDTKGMSFNQIIELRKQRAEKKRKLAE